MAPTLYGKDSSNGCLLQLGTDDAQLTNDSSTAHTQVCLTGNIVKVDPATLAAGYNALSPENHATMTGIQLSQSIFDIAHSELPRRLHTPGGEDLIGMVMVVIVIMATAAVTIFVMVMLMVVVMTVTAAAAVAIFMVVMLMMVVVMAMTATAVTIFVVVMLMVIVMTVAAAAAVVILMVVLMMVVVMAMTATAVTIFVMVMVMMAMMSVTTAAAVTFLMMVVLQFLNGLFHRSFSSHGLQHLRARQFAPGGRHQGRLLIMLPQQSHRCIQFCLGDHVGTRQNDRGGGFDLIIIELTEVLHINLDLTGISHCHCIAQLHILAGYLFHRCHHIGQLAHSGGLNDDPIGMILLDYLVQCLAKVTHQRAADTAGVHLRNVDARLLEKATVNADLTEFIFDENQLLTAVGFLDHFLDQCGLAGSKKTGINIDFSHK